ncbi:MAG TPA: DUF4998 domain-containing protein [Membranihabitans sp.]|nr:DUF4998 domain-containing protein [Membranihabitans sp.]
MKYNTSFLLLVFLIGSALMMTSCDDMDDIQKKYADEDEIIYLGRVDSVKVVPGFGRVKLLWELSADPRVERVKVYWNNNQESAVKEFSRQISGVIEDSLIIENLPEGSYTFELRTESDLYNPSLPTIASGVVWGPNKGDELGSRSFTRYNPDVLSGTYTLDLSPTQKVSSEENMVYTKITYTNSSGNETTVRVHPDSSQIVLEDFVMGSEYTMQDAFVSTVVFDTIFNNPRVFKAPDVIQHQGSLVDSGDPDGKYFSISENELVEWTPTGDLITFNWDGTAMSPGEHKIVADLSRDSFRALFYYGNNKFIAISNQNEVVMHQLLDDTMAIVQTPAGADAMGVGFNFEKFVRGTGYFYSVTAGTGELKTWFALENATWGTPNGTTVATGFDRFEKITYFGTNLVAIDGSGGLWHITVKATGEPSVYRKIGHGWDRFEQLVSLGSDLLAIDEDGNIYTFGSLQQEEKYWVVE